MNSDEKNLKIISKTLAPTAECLIQSNVKIPKKAVISANSLITKYSGILNV